MEVILTSHVFLSVYMIIFPNELKLEGHDGY